MKLTNKLLGFSLAAVVGFTSSLFADDAGGVKKSLESRIAELEAKDRKSTRLNSSHSAKSRMPSSA